MRHTQTLHVPGLDAGDMELLTERFVELEPWYPYDQYLRLMQASFDILCREQWGALREFCSRGVGPVYELGFGRLLFPGDPVRTLEAVSIMWRSCHDFGSAWAETDAYGTTIHVIDYPDVEELDGNVNAGWFLGMARCGGAEVTQIELRRCPWLGHSDEQVVRLEWRVAAVELEPGRDEGATLRPAKPPRKHAMVG
jgi:hypothetical protein